MRTVKPIQVFKSVNYYSFMKACQILFVACLVSKYYTKHPKNSLSQTMPPEISQNSESFFSRGKVMGTVIFNKTSPSNKQWLEKI
jgi:hypothetical protein